MATSSDSCRLLYAPILKYILTPEELTSSKLKTIINEDRLNAVKESKEKDTEKVLQILYLIDECEAENKWELFNEVLDILGFVFIQKALLKQDNEETCEKLRRIIEVLAEADLDTPQLSEKARAHGLIEEVNQQNVLTECDNYDEKSGLIVLIDSVATPPPDQWYEAFLECLNEIGRKDIVIKLSSSDECTASRSDWVPGESLPTDEYWRKLTMEVFHEFVISNVRPSDLIVNLVNILDKDDVRRIRRMQRQQSEKEAMSELLIKIDESTADGKWAAFRDALHHANYFKIIEAFDGKQINFDDQEKWQKMIEIFTGKLSKKINPREILPDLVNENLISTEESQEITQDQQNEGEINANFSLLMCIQRRHPNWYPVFMEILFLKEWDETVHDIDYDMWKELNQKHEGKMSEKSMFYAEQDVNMAKGETSKTLPMKVSESDVKESHVSYTEKPVFSRNNLSVPNIENQDEGEDLYKGTMHDLSFTDDNSVDRNDDEETSVKQIKLPPPAVRSQSQPKSGSSMSLQTNNFSSSLPQVSGGASNLPQASVGSDFWVSNVNNVSYVSDVNNVSNVSDVNIVSNVSNIQPDSLMLNTVLGNLEKEVGGEEDRNIPVNVFENMKNIDSDDSDDDDQPKIVEPLELRSYQEELAAPGLQGRNCIIVAPTGSGKTHVALKIIQTHMNNIRVRRHPKVVFLVEQSALAEQQANQVTKYLPCKVKLITGEVQRNERQKSFAEWLAKRDILVVTAQLLVNALADKDVRISDFTLLVFDECHHAHANHSYNQIMHCYMDELIKEKTEKKDLPMIVGLTASVGVGRTKTTEGAIDWIKRMMANLDAEDLATVRYQNEELNKHVVQPEQIIYQSAPRKKNYFGEAVSKIMEVTEKYMKQSDYSGDIADKDKVLKAPPDKGSDQYTQWVSKFWRETAKIFKQDARRFFTTCRSYLDLYNRALIVYEDARVKDALDFLEDNIRKMNENIIQDETDKKMVTLYEKSKALLKHCVNDTNHDNPKLETLRKLVARTYRENMDSRGIIFVKTRDLTTAIQNWMKDEEFLKVLSPIKFVGAQAGGEKGGMTRNDQDNILKLFKDGRHKIIIATSVAEEGLDIQKCNLVIRYDHVTNEIAMVQARGRGRAEGSRYYVVASAQKKTAEKEELNMMREDRMNEAIRHLQDEINKNRDSFLREIKQLQEEANIARELENTNKGGRIVKDSEFEMRCGKCNAFICMSNDVKKIQNAHHAVIGNDIASHITTIRLPKPTFEDENIKMGVGKVNCKKCGKTLGNIVIYKKAQFPVLKIENFLVADCRGNTDLYKKWKNAPFIPKELSTGSLMERVQGPKYIPMED